MKNHNRTWTVTGLFSSSLKQFIHFHGFSHWAAGAPPSSRGSVSASEASAPWHKIFSRPAMSEPLGNRTKSYRSAATPPPHRGPAQNTWRWRCKRRIDGRVGFINIHPALIWRVIVRTKIPFIQKTNITYKASVTRLDKTNSSYCFYSNHPFTRMCTVEAPHVPYPNIH